MYKIYNQDCFIKIKEIKDKSVDLVITDPPYMIETQGGGMYLQKDKQYVKELKKMKDGFSTKILDELCRIMKQINIYIFCSQKQIIPLLNYFVTNKKCNYNIITWHKTNPVPACGNKYLTDTEYVLFFRERGVRIYGSYETKRTYYITPLNTADKKLYGHPTCKPVNIIENFVINSSKKDDVVFDPFMGSGSTGVACVKNSRNFVGIELEQKYCDIANKRMADTIIEIW